MGLFDALFGSSIKERMLPYFQGRGQPMHERISRCVREIYPTLELSDITPFHEAGGRATGSGRTHTLPEPKLALISRFLVQCTKGTA